MRRCRSSLPARDERLLNGFWIDAMNDVVFIGTIHAPNHEDLSRMLTYRALVDFT